MFDDLFDEVESPYLVIHPANIVVNRDYAVVEDSEVFEIREFISRYPLIDNGEKPRLKWTQRWAKIRVADLIVDDVPVEAKDSGPTLDIQ